MKKPTKIYRTAQGKQVDLEKILGRNEKSVAVGNASMNAKGDMVTKGGKVVKTKEQLANEYYRANPNSIKKDSELVADEFVEPTFDNNVEEPKEEQPKKPRGKKA